MAGFRRWIASIRSPLLDKFDGQPLPGEETPQHERKTGGLMKSPFTFKKYGKSGIEVSELFPHVGECIDDICVIRSMHTEIPNHEPALIMMNTGANVSGRPSMGSWLTYGLGTENKKSTQLRSSVSRCAYNRGTSALEFGLFAPDVPGKPTSPTMRNRKSSILRS